MAESTIHFEEGDLDVVPLPEGYHEGTVERARFHTSRQGNATLQVQFQIDGALRAYDDETPTPW